MHSYRIFQITHLFATGVSVLGTFFFALDLCDKIGEINDKDNSGTDRTTYILGEGSAKLLGAETGFSSVIATGTGVCGAAYIGPGDRDILVY